MNLVTGEIVEIYLEEDITMGKVRVGMAFVRVPLTLVPGIRPGDWILIESGVAIAHVASSQAEKPKNKLPGAKKR